MSDRELRALERAATHDSSALARLRRERLRRDPASVYNDDICLLLEAVNRDCDHLTLTDAARCLRRGLVTPAFMAIHKHDHIGVIVASLTGKKRRDTVGLGIARTRVSPHAEDHNRAWRYVTDLWPSLSGAFSAALPEGRYFRIQVARAWASHTKSKRVLRMPTHVAREWCNRILGEEKKNDYVEANPQPVSKERF